MTFIDPAPGHIDRPMAGPPPIPARDTVMTGERPDAQQHLVRRQQRGKSR
jgi:hypothetical protein